jgi:hypothetical protein
MFILAFWSVTLCNLVGGYQVFGETFLQNIRNHLQDYMVSQPRSLQLTHSLPWKPQISVIRKWYVFAIMEMLLWTFRTE